MRRCFFKWKWSVWGCPTHSLLCFLFVLWRKTNADKNEMIWLIFTHIKTDFIWNTKCFQNPTSTYHRIGLWRCWSVNGRLQRTGLRFLAWVQVVHKCRKMVKHVIVRYSPSRSGMHKKECEELLYPWVPLSAKQFSFKKYTKLCSLQNHAPQCVDYYPGQIQWLSEWSHAHTCVNIIKNTQTKCSPLL